MSEARFVAVTVDPHPALPEGLFARWRVAGELRVVRRIRFEPDDGPAGEWSVQACRSDGSLGMAEGIPVDDSSAGLSLLVRGGRHGLRLRHVETGAEVAEPYLLLDPEEVVE